jgi:uncharacterized membrane protein
MLKRFITIPVFLLSASVCLATGWNDYRRDIGDGYSIFRANSFDRGVSYKNSGLIDPYAFPQIGPVYGYYVTDAFIFARAYGRKMRNLFEGDTFEETDRTEQFYFILKKGENEITGPLLLSEFEVNDVVQQHSPIQWQPPRNPNFWRPLLGSFMFLAIAIPILAIKFFWVSIPVIVVGILLVIKILKRKRKKAQPCAQADRKG